jgi:omega-hydroxy-beta-dihydromenaquinone-9 sulfotransferase
MKTSYVFIGATLRKIFRLFARNGFLIHPVYIFRFFLLFQSGIWSSVFKIVERIRYNRKINSLPPPEKPVFIIGHWRTGSTFLHQLMCLDDRFITPTVFQVTVPDCYLSIERYYKPVMRKMMDTTRPMDNVKFSPDAPQEDEFALFRLTLKSPLQNIVFPRKCKYFLTDDDNFINSSPVSRTWEKSIHYFYRKLVFRNGKRLLIKNPFHSMRLKTLQRLFPDAVFIHIYRNPLDVVPSTIRMWDIIARQNCMNKKWTKADLNEVLHLYQTMLRRIERDMSSLPADRFAEIRYEDLEKHPVQEIERIYDQLHLDFPDALKENIKQFIDAEKDFQKNEHHLNEQQVEVITSYMNEFMKEKGYL